MLLANKCHKYRWLLPWLCVCHQRIHTQKNPFTRCHFHLICLGHVAASFGVYIRTMYVYSYITSQHRQRQLRRVGILSNVDGEMRDSQSWVHLFLSAHHSTSPNERTNRQQQWCWWWWGLCSLCWVCVCGVFVACRIIARSVKFLHVAPSWKLCAVGVSRGVCASMGARAFDRRLKKKNACNKYAVPMLRVCDAVQVCYISDGIIKNFRPLFNMSRNIRFYFCCFLAASAAHLERENWHRVDDFNFEWFFNPILTVRLPDIEVFLNCKLLLMRFSFSMILSTQKKTHDKNNRHRQIVLLLNSSNNNSM